MLTPLLVFQTRSMEDRFRKVMKSNHEIGGFLFVSSWQYTIADYNETKELFGTFAETIHAWMIVPNESKSPQNQWWSSKYYIAKEIAEASAHSMGCSILDFHTHPNGHTNDPSGADAKFAIKEMPTGKGQGELAIVQSSPLRVNYFRFQQSSTGRFYHHKGEFLSWRSPKIHQILL